MRFPALLALASQATNGGTECPHVPPAGLHRAHAVGSNQPWVARSLLTDEADPSDMAVIDLSGLSAERKVVIASVVSL